MSAGRERGIALVTVLLVLAALVALATPFSLSMRNEDRGASHRAHEARAEQDLQAALEWAEERLSGTEDTVDPTPLWDGPAEWRLDEEELERTFGAEVRNPKGTILSADAEDVSGLADLVHPSLLLLHNLSGGAYLAQDLSSDEEAEIRVVGGEGLPEQGLLWIEGELVLYRHRSGNLLTGLSRAFDTSLLKSRPRADHPYGAPAVDYRWITVLVMPFRDGVFRPFPSVRALESVSDLGEVAFLTEEVDALERWLTVRAPLCGQRSFTPVARLLLDVGPASEPEIVVGGGRSFGPGSILRLREGEAVDYVLVTGVVPLEGGVAQVSLQQPPRVPFTGGEAVVEALARAPLDVNAAPRPVLEAWAHGVRFAGSGGRVDAREAAALAERILERRPLRGFGALASLLGEMVAEGRLSEEDAEALLVNAEDARDARLAVSSAPLVFRSGGLFRVRLAVSENLPAGREAARRFAEVVTEPRPPHVLPFRVVSQEAFEELWRLSRRARGWDTGPVNLFAADVGADPPLRAPALREGRRPADGPGFARLRPLRHDGRRDETAEMAEGLSERMLHFDAVAAAPFEVPSADPLGYDFGSAGPLSLATDSPLVEWLDPDGWMRPIALDFWWTPGEGAADGETFLFDSGDLESDKYSEITNRVWAVCDRGELVFRVADASVPDPLGERFGAEGEPSAEEWPIQVAEIRYAFDDGLPFEEDVPYRLTFYARGTKPSDLALFVDGIPRGRRSFQTRLRADLGLPPDVGPLAQIPGYTAGSTEKIPVEDARAFPKFGVVRIDRELIEYTDRTDDELIVSRRPGDAFGGRARRGSRPRKHLESETVELYGYVGVLLSPRIPTGRVGLANSLGRFGVAMVDPEAAEVKTPISTTFTGQQGNVVRQIGRGLSSTAQTIPLVPLHDPNDPGSMSTSAPQPAELFDPDGGFALLVSSPVPPPSTNAADLEVGDERAEVSPSRVLRTPNGELIGYGELIYYSSFGGNRLSGVLRAPQAAESTTWAPEGHSNLLAVGQNASDDRDLTASAPHVHVAEWQKQHVGQGHEARQPIYVVPISVRPGLPEAEVPDAYPLPILSGNVTRPEMIQVGRGFAGFEQGGGTEWIRYDVIGRGCFVRDEPTRIRKTVVALATELTARYTQEGQGKLPDPEAVARAVTFEAIAARQNEVQALALQAMIPEGLLEGGMLAFRGVLGTEARPHPAGALVLPVIRTFRWSEWAARPGARDYVTLVDPATRSREEQRINYAYTGTDVEGWGGSACHLAFDAGVEGAYEANLLDLLEAVDPDDPNAGAIALQNTNVESRHLTRILKFPSGELPTAIGEEVHFGGDLRGEPSPVGGRIDEIEFFTPKTPHEVIPRHHRYVLSRDDELGDTIHLWRNVLYANFRTIGGTTIEEIDPVGQLPDDGFVLLVGDELVAVEDVVAEEENEVELRVAPAGRGFLGTPIHFHPQRSPVREMTFLRVSRLEETLGEDDAVVAVADASDFPERGYLLIGQEIVGYERKAGHRLLMPRGEGEGGRVFGLFRGRFGTRPTRHERGSLALVFRPRFDDRWIDASEAPEITCFPFVFWATGARFDALSFRSRGGSDLARVAAWVGVGASADPTADPLRDPRVLLLEGAGAHRIGLTGDVFEARFHVRYGEGAFDASPLDPTIGVVRGGSNDWKRAPTVEDVRLEYVAPTVRHRYEEWR